MLTAQVALLNGLIGETDSLIKGILSTMDESWDQKRVNFFTETMMNLLGFYVIVPSNPETSFFQLTEGILSLLKDKDWGNHNLFNKSRVLTSIISYLAT